MTRVLGNILDPIRDELSPHLWDQPESTHPVLKPQHRKWIKANIYKALSAAGYTDVEKWLRLVLTGSLTTYQYSEASDCDVSLFVDTKMLPEWSRGEMIGVMVGKVDGTTLPGTPFVMQDFVVPSGLKPSDLYQPGLRSGYDIDKEKWIVPPERDRVHDVEQEENGFYVFALQMADKMESLLRYEPDKAVEFWHQIHKRRARDQAAGKGDFAESNIVYKFLANRNLFPAISQASGEYIAKTKISGGDWFAPSYMIPDDAKEQIHQWVQQQPWPEGTKLPEPEKYHVTGIYSPSGFADPEHQAWAQSKSGAVYPVQTTGVDAFSPSGTATHAPIVLRVQNPDLIVDTEQMTQEAKDRGLPISEFSGGYKPHITVAHSPHPIELQHPNLSFPVGPLRDLHGYYDELKQRSSGIISNHGTQTNSSHHQSDYPQTPQGNVEAQIEPAFPDVNNAVEANQALLGASGQVNHALLRPEVLESALGRAANQWHYTGSMANAAAAIAHGVGQAQAFEDGNKRTAYWLTQQFLRQNGYPEAAPDDDEELADHLIGYGEGTHGMDDTARMFTRRPRISKVAAWNDHFVNQIKPIADAYEQMPMYDPDAAEAWQELANDSVRRAADIGRRLNVSVTDNPEPYADHQAMFDDINRGNLQVSRANSEHPIWTPEQNVAFRTVHDVEGHYPSGGDFGWEGENKACGAHFPTLSPNAQRALMTECLGQTGYAIDRGGFGPQKVGFMDEHLQPAQQSYNQVTPQGTFSYVTPPRGFCHRHIRHGIYRLYPQNTLSAIKPEVAKFVYHPVHNKMLIGEMGREEGKMPNHSELFQQSGFDPNDVSFGQVRQNGYVDIAGRPRIVGPQRGGMNQYQQQYRTEEALRRTVPGVKFTNAQELLNPEWELPGDPEVQYMGKPPVVQTEEDAATPAQWEF